MIAVIFEVEVNPDQGGDYFDIAGELRPLLADADGFVSIERFESLVTPGKFLSLSWWRDEEAVTVWRNTAGHREAQAQGRQRIFKDYRIRVASVLRDYSMTDHAEAPGDSNIFHDK